MSMFESVYFPEYDNIPQHNAANTYDQTMLFINILAKNYICVMRQEMQVDPGTVSEHIYVGQQFDGIIFADRPPIMKAKDYKEFFQKVENEYGSMKSLFEQNSGRAVKIHVEHRHLAPLFYYFLMHLEQAYSLDESVVQRIIRKTNERFFIYDGKNLNLRLATYNLFKQEVGEIAQDDLIYDPADYLNLPLEYVFLFFKEGILSKNQMLAKIDSIKPYLFNLSISRAARMGLEILVNDPRIMQEFNGTDIENIDNIIDVIDADPTLKKLFRERAQSKSDQWYEDHIDRIRDLFLLIKQYDLEIRDPFPGQEEFEILYNLFYSEDTEAALDELLGPTGYNFHELEYVDEYKNKINTTLIADTCYRIVNESGE